MVARQPPNLALEPTVQKPRGGFRPAAQLSRSAAAEKPRYYA